jgi:hypothetical protein
MKGYRKISDGSIHCSAMFCDLDDNYELDSDIRSKVHFPIIEETQRSRCEEYYVVVYKKINKFNTCLKKR